MTRTLTFQVTVYVVTEPKVDKQQEAEGVESDTSYYRKLDTFGFVHAMLDETDAGDLVDLPEFKVISDVVED